MKSKVGVVSLLVSGLFVGCPDSSGPIETSVDDDRNAVVEEEVKTVDETEKINPALPYTAKSGFLTIDGRQIDPARFNEKMRLLASFGKTVAPSELERYRDRAVDEIVRTELLFAATKDTKVDKAEVDASMKTLKAEIEDFEGFLNGSGKTEEGLRAEIELSLRVQAYLASRGATVTDSEAKAFYEENKKQFQEDATVNASHILLKIPKGASDKEKKSIKARANALAKEARAKDADFAALAKKHSQGPTAKKGGALNWFTRKRMEPSFGKAAFALKKGEVSDAVATHHGYHIIRVNDTKPATVKTFESVKETIKESMRKKKERNEIRKLVAELRKKAKIEKSSSKILKNPDFDSTPVPNGAPNRLDKNAD